MKYIIRDQNLDSEPIAPVEINRRYAAGEISADAQCREETEPDQWRPLLEAFRHLKFIQPGPLPDAAVHPQSGIDYGWHKWGARARYCMAAFMAVVATVIWCLGPTMNANDDSHPWLPYVVGGMFMLGALLVPLDRHTRVDQASGTVSYERSWFGRPYACETWPFSDFAAIVYARDLEGSDSDGRSSSHDVVWVCLLLKSRRALQVTYFWSEGQGGPCGAAVVCAYDLARKTGLRIIPEERVPKG
ncbi:MAG TPA: hypothetical protein VGO11_23530 [Chthoniobacteraceae bacterium]|jgi:hypothetical protein|nr:hypothetical protein [Chthoniobacteraceae bacterium]